MNESNIQISSIVVKSVLPEQVDILYNIINDPDNLHHQTINDVSKLYLKKCLETQHDNHGFGYIDGDVRHHFIYKKKQVIGWVSLTTKSALSRRYELGYTTTKKHRGKGYTYKALRHFIATLFGVDNINRLEAIPYADNKKSINLLVRLGFKHEGLLRKHNYHDGEYVDCYMYSMLKEDLEETIASDDDIKMSWNK